MIFAPRTRIDRFMPTPDLAEQTRQRALRMLRDGAPRREILTCLVTAAESLAGSGSVASILVIDKDGLLRNGASPNLPTDYLDAIDRLRPDARVGTCAAAAATGNVVETPDFRADEKWAELRHLPLALGFAGAWSMPIRLEDGAVLGTFGTYYRERRRPTTEERDAVGILASAAAIALSERAVAADDDAASAPRGARP
jgi:GAF domain-containing protein